MKQAYKKIISLVFELFFFIAQFDFTIYNKTVEKVFLAIRDFETARAFQATLSDYYDVELFSNEVDALNALLEKQYACIIIDFSVSTLDGEAILDYLIASHQFDNQPICVVIDPPDLQTELNLFNRGCAEIFNKPVDSLITRKRIQNVVTISKLQKNVTEYEQKLITDPMTGLLNKDGFQAKVRKELKQQIPGAFIMCDMDGLKYINDNFSHQVGDSIIIAVAEQIASVFSENSIVSHISGDEYCIFVKNKTSQDEISFLCERLLSSILSKVLLPDLSRPVSLSIGIAMYPTSAQTYETLISKADHALLYVKNHGKGSFKFHAPRDDREELLKGRQECTNVPASLMLKKRDDEDIQTWLKFGEFRIVYITYQKYSSNVLSVNFSLINIVDLKNKDNPDSKKVTSLNEKITTFIREAEYPGIFSWYSINQLLILTENKETISRGLNRLREELSAEMKALQLDIELKEQIDS